MPSPVAALYRLAWSGPNSTGEGDPPAVSSTVVFRHRIGAGRPPPVARTYMSHILTLQHQADIRVVSVTGCEAQRDVVPVQVRGRQVDRIPTVGDLGSSISAGHKRAVVEVALRFTASN